MSLTVIWLSKKKIWHAKWKGWGAEPWFTCDKYVMVHKTHCKSIFTKINLQHSERRKKSPFPLYKLNLLSMHKIKRFHAIYYLWKKSEKVKRKNEEKEQRKGRKKVTFSCLLPHLSINTSAALTHFKTAESERSLMGITQRTAGSFWIFK